jgi:hypothetical protein
MSAQIAVTILIHMPMNALCVMHHLVKDLTGNLYPRTKMNTLKEIANNFLYGFMGIMPFHTEPTSIVTTEEETDQDVLYRKQREYMRTNHW